LSLRKGGEMRLTLLAALLILIAGLYRSAVVGYERGFHDGVRATIEEVERQVGAK
jgi:hypothetical protein